MRGLITGSALSTNIEERASGLSGTLVSVGLPVRNGEQTLEAVVKSVQAQDYEPLELVITDNASTDNTETLCRDLAAADKRIVYYRHATNVGLLNNFMHAVHLAKGAFFRWVGDDDWLAPNYVSSCMRMFESDRRLVLVTTQLKYILPDGSDYTLECPDKTLSSDDRIQRFDKLISYLIEDSLPFDPLYALARRSILKAIPRRNVMNEDEVFAAKLALAGPWGHVPEILGTRNVRIRGYGGLARFLDLPQWQAHVPTAVECWELFRFLPTAELTPSQRLSARLAVARMLINRHYRTLVRRMKKLPKMVLR